MESMEVKAAIDKDMTTKEMGNEDTSESMREEHKFSGCSRDGNPFVESEDKQVDQNQIEHSDSFGQVKDVRSDSSMSRQFSKDHMDDQEKSNKTQSDADIKDSEKNRSQKVPLAEALYVSKVQDKQQIENQKAEIRAKLLSLHEEESKIQTKILHGKEQEIVPSQSTAQLSQRNTRPNVKVDVHKVDTSGTQNESSTSMEQRSSIESAKLDLSQHVKAQPLQKAKSLFVFEEKKEMKANNFAQKDSQVNLVLDKANSTVDNPFLSVKSSSFTPSVFQPTNQPAAQAKPFQYSPSRNSE